MLLKILRLVITGEEIPSLFKPWEIIKVLTAMLTSGVDSISKYAADCVGIVGLPEEIGRIRTTFVQSNKMRDKVLSLLSGGLVTYTRIVLDGLCDGNHVQQCNVCMEEVAVTKVVVEHVLLYFLMAIQFSCSGQVLYTPYVAVKRALIKTGKIPS